MGSSSKKRKRDRDRLARQETPTDSVGSRAEASKVLEDVWAQCEKCNKWRRLPPGSVVQEDDPW